MHPSSGAAQHRSQPICRDRRGTVFAVRLRVTPGTGDPIRALRSVLKFAWRRYRLKCIEAVEVREGGAP